MTKELREQNIKLIIEELNAHNEDIGADERDEARVRSDAKYILMHREGVTTETICMMLTDMTFGVKAAKSERDAALARVKAFEDTMQIVRDAVLHERGPLAEAGLDGDQINAVLSVIDDGIASLSIIDAALSPSATPGTSEQAKGGGA